MSSERYKNLRAYVQAQPRSKSLVDIAAELGMPPSTLSAYLGGHRMPGRELALRLSRDFDISLEGLLDPELASEVA